MGTVLVRPKLSVKGKEENIEGCTIVSARDTRLAFA